MTLSEKIIDLRKAHGWSQEDLAEKMNVSRQAISRWENGSALPEALNILQISKLFNVTTDYLLNDDYESDRDIPAVQIATQKTEGLFLKKKQLHLIAAIGFAVATACWLVCMGVAANVNPHPFGLAFLCFSLFLCASNAVAQFVLYFKKQ